MKQEYSHSDERLRSKVEGVEMTPPANAWAGIEQGMSAASKRRRKGFFFFFTVLFLLFIGTSLAAFFILKSPENGTIHQTQVESNPANRQQTQAEDERIPTKKENTIEQSTNRLGTGDHPPKNDQKLNSTRNQSQLSQRSVDAKNNLPDTAKKVQAKTTRKEPTSKSATTTEPNSANSTGTANTSVENESGPSKEKNEAIAAASTSSNELKQPNFLQPHPLTPLTTDGSGGLVSIAHKPMPYKKAAWSAEAGFGISQFQYKASSGSASLQQGIKDAQSGEQGTEAFALVNYQFNRHWSAYTGMQYSQEKNALDYTTTSTSSQLTVDTVGWIIDTVTQVQTPILDSNYTTTTSNQNNQVQNQANFLTIPIGVMFSFPVGVRSEFGVRASALIGFRTKSQGAVLTNLNGTTVDMNSAYLKSGILTFNAAFRYSFALNEKNKIYVEPWVGFGLNNRSTPVLPYNSRFNASGIRIGIRRQF